MFDGGFIFLLAAVIVGGLLAGLLGSVLFILGSALQSRPLRLLAMPPFGCAALVLLALVALAALIIYGAFTGLHVPP